MDHAENAPVPGPPKPGPAAPAPAAPEPAEQSDSPVPETGDIVVDATLRDLAVVDAADLDATLAAGESVHATLTARLSDLGT